MCACLLGATVRGSPQCNHQGVDISLSICHCGLHGVVADELPRSGLARRPGAPDPRCAGAPSLGPPGRNPSPSVVPRPVRQGSAPCRDAGCDLDCAAGLAGRRAEAHGQGSLDRLVPAAEAVPPAPGRPELSLCDPAVQAEDPLEGPGADRPPSVADPQRLRAGQRPPLPPVVQVASHPRSHPQVVPQVSRRLQPPLPFEILQHPNLDVPEQENAMLFVCPIDYFVISSRIVENSGGVLHGAEISSNADSPRARHLTRVFHGNFPALQFRPHPSECMLHIGSGEENPVRWHYILGTMKWAVRLSANSKDFTSGPASRPLRLSCASRWRYLPSHAHLQSVAGPRMRDLGRLATESRHALNWTDRSGNERR